MLFVNYVLCLRINATNGRFLQIGLNTQSGGTYSRNHGYIVGAADVDYSPSQEVGNYKYILELLTQIERSQVLIRIVAEIQAQV